MEFKSNVAAFNEISNFTNLKWCGYKTLIKPVRIQLDVIYIFSNHEK